MKFINFLQISAIAMSAAVDAAEPHFHEPHSLRGPVMVADADANAHKSSTSSDGSGSSSRSGKNKSGSSSDSSSSGKSGSSTDSSSDKSDSSNKSGYSYSGGSRSAGTRAKSSKSPTVPTAEDVENFPEFFPSDMNKEKMTEEQIEYWNDNGYDNGNNNGKKTAAQKRQEQRDARRETDNPDRSQDEENRERARKTEQSQRSGNAARDPYSEENGWGAQREAQRIARCERNYNSCRYSGPNSWCYNDCITGNQRVNQECADYCRFVDAECYDACRGGNGVGYCVDDCNVSIERESDRRRIIDRTDRDDYRQVDRCELSCESWNRNSHQYRSCMLDCDVVYYSEDDELYFDWDEYLKNASE